MKKNVLPEAVKALGIQPRDVVRVYRGKIARDYQYENGVFNQLNQPISKSGKDTFDRTMTEDELYELLNGGEFEILAYGAKPTNEELLHKIEEIDATVKQTQEFVNNINEAVELGITQEVTKKQKCEKVISGVCDVILCVAGLVGFFILLALIF